MVRLTVCGAINLDITCFVDYLPSPGEEVLVRQLKRVSGGTAANVAVAAARILGQRTVALIAALGKDDIAQQQTALLRTEGIATDSIKLVPGAESGLAFILVDRSGENVIATTLGANAELGAKDIKSSGVERHLRNSALIVITDPPLEAAKALIDFASQRNMPVLWDPGVLLAHGWDTLHSMMAAVDTLFCNETEATALFNTAQPGALLKQLRGLGLNSRVVLKRGRRGAALLETTGNIIEIPALPLESLGMEVVDTVGCGDAFVGAYAAYKVLGADNHKALLMAGVAGGLNAASEETRASPDRNTIEQMSHRAQGIGYSAKITRGK